MVDERYVKIAKAFGLPGILTQARRLGNGHINETVLLVFDDNGTKKELVLQKINKYVFHHPDELMENMVGVTEFLRKKVIASGGDPEREVLTVIPAADGRSFYIDEDGEYWRLTKCISNVCCREMASGPDEFRKAGYAFGHFQSQLSEYPAETLHETIPFFHDTRVRYRNFIKSVEEDKMGRAASCANEIKFILDRKSTAFYLMDSFDKGDFPLRVTHNDTKFNNILFDLDTGEPICILDLDTVMPGLAMSDFGDAIRTGACTAVEDEPDVDKVKCDIELFDSFSDGFITGCNGKLTEHEINALPTGALVATYEQGLRFLADYLDGDVYFRTAYPEHNLVRTHTQIRMVEELEAKWDKLQNIIQKYK